MKSSLRDYDEKITEPMFPRLHVKDADKGGPKAPPRNKMALYEQFSIPSQRVKPELSTLNPTNNNNLVAPGSSVQGGGLDRNLSFLHRVLPTIPTSLAEKYYVRNSDRTNTKTPLAQLEKKSKRVGNEDDLTVPVFVHSETRHRSKTHSDLNGENRIPPSSTYSGHSLKPPFSQDPKKIIHIGPISRDERKNSNMDRSMNATSKLSNEKTYAHKKVANNTCTSQKPSDDFASDFTRFHNKASCVQKDSRNDSLLNTAKQCDVVESRDQSCDIFQFGNEEKSDDMSETSIVDSIFGTAIYPDDVVGMIGQKHFWNARKTIANQQRAFAVQLFELHRLIKVQQLIAGSPHILLEDLTKQKLNSAPADKASTEYIVKPLPRILKRKDDSEKPSQKMECSAENTVQKTNDPPTSTRGSYPGPSPQTPVVIPGQQWLVPVMSPSEGLIYKPYAGHGFPGAFPPGPFGPTPMIGNSFMNLPYGIPANHHPGTEAPPGHGYFYPYGMQVMNPAVSNSSVEQTVQYPGPTSHGQVRPTNSDMQNESSGNIPTRKNRFGPPSAKFQVSIDTERQGSSASGLGEIVQREGLGPTKETGDARPPSLMKPVVTDGVSQRPCQPARVIKIVPRNPKLASESAARIFRSLQAERKQFGSS